jgi:hypothetical protein
VVVPEQAAAIASAIASIPPPEAAGAPAAPADSGTTTDTLPEPTNPTVVSPSA